jgi:hypothetical protein
MSEDYVPGCFKTKQFCKTSGICKQCHKYRECEVGIKLQGHKPYPIIKEGKVMGNKIKIIKRVK